MTRPQDTPEWREDRRERITASRFGDVMAKPTSKRYQQYKRELILAIRGAPDFDSSRPWHEDGKKTEPEGLATYEWETGNTITPVGLIVHPRYDFIGCSPDGLIGADGGVELKCRTSLKAHMECKTRMQPVHKPQVQGGLWVTGRAWWDFASYYKPRGFLRPRSDLIVTRVLPDAEYHKRLEERCLQLWNEIQEET